MFLNNSILLLNISVLQILYLNSIKIEGSFKIKNKKFCHLFVLWYFNLLKSFNL